MKKNILFILAIFSFLLSSYGQNDPVKDDFLRFNRPTTSQRGEISQKIGISFIKINYGRPNVKNRKIFGGLLEYGKIWRLGADYQTLIKFKNEFLIQGKTIPKGTYALYAIPNKDNWIIYFNNDIQGWGQYTYKKENNVFEFTIPVKKSPEFTETFTIGFINTSMNKGELIFQWENIRTKLPITVSAKHKNTIKFIMESTLGLKEQNLGYKYYLASEYMFIEEKDYKTALKYIQKAIDTGNNAFYTHYLKGEILYALGDKQKAVEAAKQAKKNLFKGFANPEWENKIEKAISDWKN